MGRHTYQKRNTVTDCYSCEYCRPIGEGTSLCEKWQKAAVVLRDWTPTEAFLSCRRGKKGFHGAD